MVRVEVEISASVDRFPVDFGDQCRLFPDGQNIKKGNRTDCISIVNWIGFKLLRWLRKSYNRSGP
jgi:hypothetical protein